MFAVAPPFEADLPPEQYAYRPGRNAQQAVVKVEELLFRGHPGVVDADLADYFGSLPPPHSGASMPSRCACSLSVGSAGDLDLDRLRACDDARLVLFASLNPSKETGTARTNFLRAPPWDAIKPKP
jgi:hypothetical protein